MIAEIPNHCFGCISVSPLNLPFVYPVGVDGVAVQVVVSFCFFQFTPPRTTWHSMSCPGSFTDWRLLFDGPWSVRRETTWGSVIPFRQMVLDCVSWRCTTAECDVFCIWPHNIFLAHLRFLSQVRFSYRGERGAKAPNRISYLASQISWQVSDPL